MKSEILVSVIIPAYNSEKYLRACLKSVLNQDFRNFEVIVVDNNSTDKTKEIISEFSRKHKNLKYIFEPKIGRGSARNTGEKQAVGKVILMTDSDCVVPEGWIRALSGPIITGEVVAVQGGEKSIGSDFWSRQIELRAEEKFEAYKKGKQTVMVDTKNFAISRTTLEGVGFTDRRYVSGNDTDLTIRLLKKGIVPKILDQARVVHINPNSLKEFVLKQFWRAYWCNAVSSGHYYFLQKTNFLGETDQIRVSIGASVSNFISTIYRNGYKYIVFNLIATVSWRAGLRYSKYKYIEETAETVAEQFIETITAIVPVRNRYDYRIRNCLKSLRNQSYKSSLIKIIVVDYGSEVKYKEEFERLCRAFDAKGTWTGLSHEVWNKSKCINIGLREVDTKYLIVVDVDVVFAKNYLETCVQIAEDFNGAVAFYPKILDCSEGLIDAKTDVILDFDKLVKKCNYRRDIRKNDFPYGVGILFAEAEIVKEIGGYDEFYFGWGNEDVDMLRRLEFLGKVSFEISNSSPVIHQWHPKNEGLEKGYKLRRRIELNRQYRENNFSIVRNGPREALRAPKTLPGSFWGVTCFFNPAQYKNKYENYLIFRKESLRQGLKLIVVELVFGDTPFEIKKTDAEIVVQVRGGKDNVMWQKEALCNIGLKHLPADCDKVAWIDCDIIFANDKWIEETSKLLERYKVVQPFTNSIRMGEGINGIEEYHKTFIEEGQSLSFANTWQTKRDEMITGDFFEYAPGYVCAARRETIEKISFYDRAIFGAADSLMIRAFCGWRHFNKLEGLSEGLIKRQYEWSLRAYQEVKNSMYYASGDIFHLWHGSAKNRGYDTQNQILKLTNFDPNRDVTINKDGILEWATNNDEVRFRLNEYFFAREERGQLERGADGQIRLVSRSKQKYRLPARIRARTLLWKIKLLMTMDLNREYNAFLGFVGKNLKLMSPKLYLQLKKYFPDRG